MISTGARPAMKSSGEGLPWATSLIVAIPDVRRELARRNEVSSRGARLIIRSVLKQVKLLKHLPLDLDFLDLGFPP